MDFKVFGVLGLLALSYITYRHVSKHGYCKIVAIKAFRYYSKVVTSYRWNYRKRIPYMFRNFTDRVTNVDSFDATVNCPGNISESIKILEATLSRPDMCVDVTHELSNFMNNLEDDWGVVNVYAHDILPKSIKYAHDINNKNIRWQLEVFYLGHADPERKIKAEEFAVKYECETHFKGILFPPYSASEKIKKGLGTPRITKAENQFSDMVVEANKYAGLKKDFYEGCEELGVIKSYIGSPYVTYVEVSGRDGIQSLVLKP